LSTLVNIRTHTITSSHFLYWHNLHYQCIEYNFVMTIQLFFHVIFAKLTLGYLLVII
jgi:hypothetical protein